MIKQLINWLKGDAAADTGQSAQSRRRVSVHASLHARAAPFPSAQSRPDKRTVGAGFEGRSENVSPGKSVLVSNGDAVDDTGARESLKLFDHAPLHPDESLGVDPYNSGKFDRSRHWDTRFRN